MCCLIHETVPLLEKADSAYGEGTWVCKQVRTIVYVIYACPHACRRYLRDVCALKMMPAFTRPRDVCSAMFDAFRDVLISAQSAPLPRRNERAVTRRALMRAKICAP